MKTTLNKILIALQGLAALCMMGAIKIWAPVCQKMLQLTTGKEVPMKCHWAGRAAIAISLIILVTAVLALLAKQGYKYLMAVNGVAAVMLFLVFNSLIGVCVSTDMSCRTTRVWGIGVAAVTLVASLVNLLSGKEGQIPG